MVQIREHLFQIENIRSEIRLIKSEKKDNSIKFYIDFIHIFLNLFIN